MKLTLAEIKKLRDGGLINTAAAHELRRHLHRGDEVVFVTPETLAMAGLSEAELEFCRVQLEKGHTWTWIHRPTSRAV